VFCVRGWLLVELLVELLVGLLVELLVELWWNFGGTLVEPWQFGVFCAVAAVLRVSTRPAQGGLVDGRLAAHLLKMQRRAFFASV